MLIHLKHNLPINCTRNNNGNERREKTTRTNKSTDFIFSKITKYTVMTLLRMNWFDFRQNCLPLECWILIGRNEEWSFCYDVSGFIWNVGLLTEWVIGITSVIWPASYYLAVFVSFVRSLTLFCCWCCCFSSLCGETVSCAVLSQCVSTIWRPT